MNQIAPDGAGLTRALAEQALAVRYETLSEEARALARQCILDYIACTLPGAAEPLTGMVFAELADQGGKETATVIGHAQRLPPLSAALVNGSASHALDFDDVNLAMPGHPSVAILPALLALAEERGSSGKDVIAAFVAGYELECRFGSTLKPGHYDGLGFHATGTIGTFGAAAACAHPPAPTCWNAPRVLPAPTARISTRKRQCRSRPAARTCATICSSTTPPATSRTAPSKPPASCATSTA
jgi:2-methylcitrate dehydratase PrpD